MNVSLVSVSPDAEKHMAYCARVSNPNNQDNENYAGLLRYCIKHQHWSIFEQAFMPLEINTTRGLAAQILRHRSFTFQEFSQRYADTNLLDANIPLPDLRRQDTKNRQNSIDDIPEKQTKFLQERIRQYFNEGMDLYNELLREGIAKSVLDLYYHSQHQLAFICLEVFVLGFIILTYGLVTEHKKSTWTLQMLVRIYLNYNFLRSQRHLSGNNT